MSNELAENFKRLTESLTRKGGPDAVLTTAAGQPLGKIREEDRKSYEDLSPTAWRLASYEGIVLDSMDEEPVKALRDNSGKPEMEYVLMFPKAMEALAAVCSAGGRKYSKGNFRLGGKPNDEYYGAAMRHLFAAYNGEDFDQESGGMHVAHAAWNLLALIELNWEGEVYDPALDKTL